MVDYETSPIVVGIDGSGCGDLALGWAAAEARLRRARVIVLHALHLPLMGYPLTGVLAPPDDRLVARRMVATAVRRVEVAAPEAAVTGRVVVGPPADALLRAGKDAAMLVVGSQDSGGFGGLLAGSVSLPVAEHAACPVLVVHPDDRAERTGPVVVGVDGPRSEPAIGWAFDEAARREAVLLAVHAWPDGSGGAPDLDDPAEMDEADQVYELLGRWRRKYPAVEVLNVHGRGRPAALVLEHCTGAQLAVVGARGLGGVRGLLLGSTSRTVLRHASCPVTVVHDRS